MQTLPVYFQKAVPGIARPGEMKLVAASYAKNVLIPKGLAVVATAGIRAKAAHAMAKAQTDQKMQEVHTAEHKKVLMNATVTVSAKVSPDGTLYAAVHAEAIATALKHAHHIALAVDAIEIPEPIKKEGAYTIFVRLGGESIPLRLIVQHT